MSGIKRTRGQQTAKLLTAAAAVVLGSSAVLNAHPYPQSLNTAPSVHWFADWNENTFPAPTDFYPTPFATNSNVASVKATLTSSANANVPLGIKVTTPLSSATATSLFGGTGYGTGHKAISYIFGDFESAGSLAGTSSNVSNITQLRQQVTSSAWTARAYVGEFALTPLYGIGFGDKQDPSRRGTGQYSKDSYKNSKVNMANTDLYPGSANFRNKSTNDWSNANIRTGLFVAPIMRMTAVQNVLNKDFKGLERSIQNGDGGGSPQYHKQIPWVTRFNNWANISLDSNNNSSDGYKFIPGQPLTQDGLSGAQTANQMMGRGDFSAQIMHYRMRDAYSVAVFEPGVQGYTKAQQQQDVRYGWYGANYAGNTDGTPAFPLSSSTASGHPNTVFAASDYKAATMSYNPIIDGTSDSAGKRSEISGTIWSGVYSLSLGKMDVLLSDLDTANHKAKFDKVGNYDVFTLKNGSGYTYDDGSLLAASRNQLIEAGMHRLLQFDLVSTRIYKNSTYSGSYSTKTIWLLNQNYQVFTNNNRNDIGIPEPTTFGMLAAAGSMAVVCRRQRRNKQA